MSTDRHSGTPRGLRLQGRLSRVSAASTGVFPRPSKGLSASEPPMPPRNAASLAERRRDWLFPALVASFVVIYSAFYPPTYGIQDEFDILGLAYSLRNGTPYVDAAGPVDSVVYHGHAISPYSPFHAAIFTPLVRLDWRIGFAVAAVFFLMGALLLRRWLKEEDLSGEWSALYFLLPGSLYYSQTLVAAVPSAVMGLAGVYFLRREPPRVFLAASALGLAVLFHNWMGVFVCVFSLVWMFESGLDGFAGRALRLLGSAVPMISMLGAYNFVTTGNPFREAYTLIGLQKDFMRPEFPPFLTFYLCSLAAFPIAGLAVFSPKWSKGWALPAAAFATVLLASMDYYRDGLVLGSASISPSLAFLAGIIPGQRFLIPVSMLACVPAARFLQSKSSLAPLWLVRSARPIALAAFIARFGVLSATHHSYLRAHATIQRVTCGTFPANANVLVVKDLDKELPAVCKVFSNVGQLAATMNPPNEAFLGWMGMPGELPPRGWLANRSARRIEARSWIWNRDVWLLSPVH